MPVSESASIEVGSYPEGLEIIPELQERYRNKKYNFKEGIILQHCTGKLTIKEIVGKTNFSEEEILEVINVYQKKGWMIIHT